MSLNSALQEFGCAGGDFAPEAAEASGRDGQESSVSSGCAVVGLAASRRPERVAASEAPAHDRLGSAVSEPWLTISRGLSCIPKMIRQWVHAVSNPPLFSEAYRS